MGQPLAVRIDLFDPLDQPFAAGVDLLAAESRQDGPLRLFEEDVGDLDLGTPSCLVDGEGIDVALDLVAACPRGRVGAA
jgi:hypothetical protein